MGTIIDPSADVITSAITGLRDRQAMPKGDGKRLAHPVRSAASRKNQRWADSERNPWAARLADGPGEALATAVTGQVWRRRQEHRGGRASKAGAEEKAAGKDQGPVAH